MNIWLEYLVPKQKKTTSSDLISLFAHLHSFYIKHILHILYSKKSLSSGGVRYGDTSLGHSYAYACKYEIFRILQDLLPSMLKFQR